MTHPKARTKPRRREARSHTDRIVITAKGRALLAAIDAGLGPVETATLIRAQQQHEQPRANPCAPQREASVTPARINGEAVMPDARPRTPAGKTGAAPLAEPTNTRSH